MGGDPIKKKLTIFLLMTIMVGAAFAAGCTGNGNGNGDNGENGENGQQELPSELIHGLDANYPPYTFMTEEGNAAGFDVEVVEMIAQDQGFNVTHKPVAWDGIVTALNEGEIDFIASGMTINPERAEKVTFSIPYDSYVHEIVVPKDSDLTVEDLKNGETQTVACQLGATSDKWVDELINERGWNIEKLGLDSYAAAAEAVTQGRAAAFVSDSAWTGPNLKKEQYSNLESLTPVGPTYYYGYAVRQGDQAILNAVNYGLQHVMGTQEWRNLRMKYNMSLG